MTELTDEAVTALLAHYDLPTDCDCDGDDCVKCSHYPTFQERASKQLKDAAPDLARALLDARADARAAVALAIERAAEVCDDLAIGYAKHKGVPGALHDAARDIRALADLDGLAMVQELRAEMDTLAAENASLKAAKAVAG